MRASGKEHSLSTVTLIRNREIVVLYPEKAGLAVVDEDEVARRYSIPGRSYADFAILRGDPSDGLPGVAGVGAKKAADLVRRYGSVQAMLDAGISNFIELSPHPVLSSMVLQCAAKLPQNVQLMPSLRQGQSERFQMLKSLAALFATGTEIDWRGVYPEGGARRRIHLPT